MRGHLDHWRALAAAPEPCGRKLDFLRAGDESRDQHDRLEGRERPRATEIVDRRQGRARALREQVQNVE